MAKSRRTGANFIPYVRIAILACIATILCLIDVFGTENRHSDEKFRIAGDTFVVRQITKTDHIRFGHNSDKNFTCPDGRKVYICGNETSCKALPNVHTYHFDELGRGCGQVYLEKHVPNLVHMIESLSYYSLTDCWPEFDFQLTTDLDSSFPFPLTYFGNIAGYVRSLLTFPDKIKERKDIAWLCSNCYAPNNRHVFVRELMKFIPIDSYGHCLSSDPEHPGYGGSSLDLYKTYKFVIVIENSNCKDYVTEKLLQPLQANTVPIVAGIDGKPDYRRFAPKGSYVNIYDFKSVADLATYLNESLRDDELYLQRHFSYKRKEDEQILNNRSISESDLLHWSRFVRFADEHFSQHLLRAEKGEDPLCRLFAFIKDKWSVKMRRKRVSRPLERREHKCLDGSYIVRHFNLTP